MEQSVIAVKPATAHDAPVIAAMVHALTREICQATGKTYFPDQLSRTTELCHDFLQQGHYTVFQALANGTVVGIATLTQGYAL